MAKMAGAKGAGEIALQWVALAEKRRAHLLELRETGRWQRYYSEASLAAQLRDAESCIAEWGVLAAPRAEPPTADDHGNIAA